MWLVSFDNGGSHKNVIRKVIMVEYSLHVICVIVNNVARHGYSQVKDGRKHFPFDVRDFL